VLSGVLWRVWGSFPPWTSRLPVQGDGGQPQAPPGWLKPTLLKRYPVSSGVVESLAYS